MAITYYSLESRRRRSARGVASLALLLLTAACAPAGPRGAGAIADKAGNPSPPITLKLVTSIGTGRPGASTVERFATAVRDLSDGQIVVVSSFGQPSGAPTAWDQANIATLRAGEFDLAVAPARAWRSIDVTTLEPLQLPFVVEDDVQADRIARDPDLVESLQSGLDARGVHGLGLFPEGARHITRLDGVGPSTVGDLRGLDVRAPLSVTTWAVLESLGAHLVDVNGTGVKTAVESGAVDAADTSLALVDSLPTTSQPAVLANVSLYYNFDVLAISADALGRLGSGVIDVLKRAAATALEDALARPPESAALANACALGLTVVNASDADRRRFEDAVVPAIAAIIDETGTNDLVGRVREIAGAPSTSVAPTCPAPKPAAPVGTVPLIDPADVKPNGGDLPNGSYRFEIDVPTITSTYQDFPKPIPWYTAVETVTLDGGHFVEDALAGDGKTYHYANVYEVHGDVVTFVFPSGEDFDIPMSVRWRWRVDDDGALEFDPYSPQDSGERVDFTDLKTVPVWHRID